MRWPHPHSDYRIQAIGFPAAAAKYFQHGTGFNITGGTQIASAGWPANNRALYLAFELDRPMIATQMYVYNGSSATAGNWDIGIYAADGTRLVSSGSTAQTGSNAPQTFNITDTLLDRGAFWLGIAASSTSTTVYRFNGGAANDWLIWGGMQEASALPLPATATFAVNTTQFIPICGFTGGSVL